MADDTRDFKPEAVDAALGDMKLEEGGSRYGELDTANGNYEDFPTPGAGGLKMSRSTTPAIQHSASQSPVKKQSASQTPKSEESEGLEVVGGDIIVTSEPGKRPKLQRKSSQKVPVRPAQLYNDLPDATAEATSNFQVIRECIYGSKYMGSADVDILDCDCPEDRRDGQNQACRDDSVCINRATKLECLDGNCNCGVGCQNQRFQRKQWADVSVIKTERKDYGLRTNSDLELGDFIFEYLGEVINEPARRRRAVQYAEVDGLKHFYFMHLTGNEIIDATKKGNLGRFCNHSCNPNCYVDKWVVGEKLRMGIFAKRNIKAGEELVFDYNADRYGSEATPCYCGEPNCTGWIGGKIQTDRANKLSLSHATIEALGIDDGDGWDTAVAKKPRKKKTGEDDEEYVSQVQPKGLDEDGVRKVMATLMQCKERWIAVKLLSRIQRCDDDRVRNRVVQMHGYQILRTTLTTWKDDNDVILQVLDILYKFPRLTRNKIQDSKIEATIETLTSSEHLDVAFEANRLLEEWGKLVVAYRIPRKKFDPNAAPVYERRNTDRIEEVSKSPQPAAIVAPTGPRSVYPSRNSNFHTPRPIPRRNFNNNNNSNGALPTGWFAAADQNGNTYYYSKAGSTTWQRPTIPAAEPPPPPKAPPKSVETAKTLQAIIDSITKPEPSSQTPQSAPTADSTPKEKKPPVEKWRSLSQDKQMKLYENTLFPHIKYVMQKFVKQLPKEDLKKFAKEVGKKLVASDFKNNRVEDPTKISDKQEKKVKQYVRSYFEKAVQKKKELDQKKKERDARKFANGNGNSVSESESKDLPDEDEADEGDETTELTPNTPLDIGASPHPSISATPSLSDLKRKRDDVEADTPGGSGGTGDDSESNKRLKEESSTPPPPPPPPPAESPLPLSENMEMQSQEETEEQKELRRQEEELMRENEEAMMMEMDGSLPSEESKPNINGFIAPHSHPNPGPAVQKVNGNGNGYKTSLGLNIDEQVRRRR